MENITIERQVDKNIKKLNFEMNNSKYYKVEII